MKIASKTWLPVLALLVPAVLALPMAAKAIGPSEHANAHASRTTVQACSCTIWKTGVHCTWPF